MKHQWNLQELIDVKTRWEQARQEAVEEIVNNPSDMVIATDAAHSIIAANEHINEAQRNIDQFDDIVRLQLIAEHLHQVMPGKWPDVKVSYFEDKGFWEAGGILMGRSTAQNAVQEMLKYCKQRGINLPELDTKEGGE